MLNAAKHLVGEDKTVLSLRGAAGDVGVSLSNCHSDAGRMPDCGNLASPPEFKIVPNLRQHSERLRQSMPHGIFDQSNIPSARSVRCTAYSFCKRRQLHGTAGKVSPHHHIIIAYIGGISKILLSLSQSSVLCGLPRYAPRGLKGNRVRIPNSSRCCKSQ